MLYILSCIIHLTRKKGMCLFSNTTNLILIKHNKSTQNSIFATEKCAQVPHKLKTLNQFGYYIYSFCKSIQVFFSLLKFSRTHQLSTHAPRHIYRPMTTRQKYKTSRLSISSILSNNQQ